MVDAAAPDKTKMTVVDTPKPTKITVVDTPKPTKITVVDTPTPATPEQQSFKTECKPGKYAPPARNIALSGVPIINTVD